MDPRCRSTRFIPTCRELGIGFVPYSPLGRGFLTGQFKKPEDLPTGDRRTIFPRFQSENFQKNLDLVKKIEELATRKKCKPSQLALAWVLAQGNDIVPIPGTKKLIYLEENAGAIQVTLTDAELRELDDAIPHGIAIGERYPAEAMRAVNR